MRFALVAFIVAAIVSVWSAAGVSADPGVTLDHASGPSSDAFVFTGAGFEPGTVLRGKYLTPAGKEYGFTAGYGEATFVAGADGIWQLSFSPSKSPYGEGATGDWKFTFCLSNETSVCYSSTFTVTGGSSGGGGGMGYGY
jgi:hypothetical protein